MESKMDELKWRGALLNLRSLYKLMVSRVSPSIDYYANDTIRKVLYNLKARDRAHFINEFPENFVRHSDGYYVTGWGAQLVLTFALTEHFRVARAVEAFMVAGYGDTFFVLMGEFRRREKTEEE